MNAVKLISAAVSGALLVTVATTSSAWAEAHPLTLAQFDAAVAGPPNDVAVDASGTVYVSLPAAGEVMKIPTGSAEVVPFARIDRLGDDDHGPLDLAVDVGGYVYATVRSDDTAINGVWRMDASTGAAEHLTGTGDIVAPGDLAVADDGSLYVVDTGSDSIWRVAPDGRVEPWASDEHILASGAPGSGVTAGIGSIALGKAAVYVSTAHDDGVVRIPILEDGGAGPAETYAHLDVTAQDIALDAEGYLYSVHEEPGLIVRWSPDGERQVVAEQADGLDRPTRIARAVDSSAGPVFDVLDSGLATATSSRPPSILRIDLDAAGGPQEPVHILTVEAQDLRFEPWELTTSSQGETRIELIDKGRVVHNFTIDELGLQIVVVPDGTAEGVLVDPPPGTYTFYCSVYGHRRAGMVGTLTVE